MMAASARKATYRQGKRPSFSGWTRSTACSLCASTVIPPALSGVTVRLLCKRACAAERAEEIGVAVVHESSGCVVRVDSHPADGVDRQGVSARTAKSQRRENLDGLGDVLQGLAPARFVEDPIELRDKRGGASRDQHLATTGERRDPRGQVDGRAEVVALVLDCRPWWRPTRTAGAPCSSIRSLAMRRLRTILPGSGIRSISASPIVLTCSPWTEASSAFTAFLKSATRANAASSPCASVRDEAGDVGEGESGGALLIGSGSYYSRPLLPACGTGCYAASSTLKLNIIPLSWCSAM